MKPKMYNAYANQVNRLLSKALTSAVNVGEGLIREHLEQIITNTVIRLSPEHALMTSEYDPQKVHSFNRVTTLGTPGGAMGENAVTPTRNSTYERATTTLKVIRRKSAVTNFLQDASSNYIDATAAEMENTLRAHIYDLNYYNVWGNSVANSYEYTGLDKFITTNRLNTGFSSGAPTVPANLSFLDAMIDKSNRKGGIRHKRAFLMSPEMSSKVSQLLTNVRINQPVGADGLGKVEIGGGWRLESYRGIPIIETTYLSGSGSGTMTTVSAASGGTTGGTLSDGTYYFRVSKLTLDGESQASAEASVTLSGGTATQKIALTFTADANALAYKVYYSATTGLTAMKLIKQVSGYAYDGDGTIGAAATSITLTTVAADTGASGSITTAQDDDFPLTAVGGVNGEFVVLWDLDPYQGLGKFAYTHSQGNRVDGLVSIKPLAETDDNVPFLIKTYGALIDSFEGTSAISRGWRVA